MLFVNILLDNLKIYAHNKCFFKAVTDVSNPISHQKYTEILSPPYPHIIHQCMSIFSIKNTFSSLPNPP